jgi:hypothetical protein
MIPFHRLLIGTGIVFSAAMALWAFVRYRQDSSTLMLILALVFVGLAAGLYYYLRHLRRFLGR